MVNADFEVRQKWRWQNYVLFLIRDARKHPDGSREACAGALFLTSTSYVPGF